MDNYYQQSSPPPPVVGQPPKIFDWLKWVLIVLVVAIFSSGGTYLFLQSQSQKPTPLPAEVSTKAGDLYREPTGSVATANWKTYTNQQYKFLIKYPPNFYVNQSTPGPILFYPVPLYVEIIDNQYVYGSMHYPEAVIEVIQTTLSPEEWVNQNGTTISAVGPGPILDKEYFYYGIERKGIKKIGSYSGFQFKSQAVSSAGLHTLIKYGSDLLIDIRNHSSGVGEFPEDTYNQILSTFKFLE